MPSNRRQYLAAAASLLGAGVAGCLGSPGDGGTDSPTDDTDSPSGSPTELKGSPSETATDPPDDAERTVGGDAVGVTDIVARKAVTYTSIMGSSGVAVADGKQFVVASVHADAELSPDEFSFHAGGESWATADPGDHGAQNVKVAGHGKGSLDMGYTDGPAYIAFAVPSPLDSDDPRIRIDHGGESAEWSLDSAAKEALAAPAPSFELESLDAPDSVEQGEGMEVSLTVSNTGDTEGRFLAAAYWPTHLIADDDESHLFESTVDAGATSTLSVTIDTSYTTDEDEPVTLSVEGYVQTSTEVQVTNAGTPA